MSTASSQHSDPLSPRRDGRADTSTVRWRRDVPEAIRSLGALANADYADIVTATVDETPADPDQFIHAALKRLPRGLVVFIPFVQRAFLCLRLELRPSTDRLLVVHPLRPTAGSARLASGIPHPPSSGARPGTQRDASAVIKAGITV